MQPNAIVCTIGIRLLLPAQERADVSSFSVEEKTASPAQKNFLSADKDFLSTDKDPLSTDINSLSTDKKLFFTEKSPESTFRNQLNKTIYL
jgi:hypothetical protein